MKHEQRNDRLRSHPTTRVARPPPGEVTWRRQAAAPTVSSTNGAASRGYACLPEGEMEGAGLSLAQPSRYRSLLVPVDGTQFGEHALPLALAIARRAGAPVRLVHVQSPMDSPWRRRQTYAESELGVCLRQGKQDYLDGLMRRLARTTSVPVKPLLVEGREVAPALCEVASAAPADLVVMATHRRGPLGRLWLGGIASAVLQRLTAPLLLVPGYDAPVDLTGDPVPQHVLIPLDGSEGAEQVLSPALGLGALAGARHTLLRVLRRVADYSLAFGQVGTDRPAADRAQAEAWRYLRRLARNLSGAATRVHPRLLHAEQSVAASILWYAGKYDADLIALATHRRGPLSRLFRGSVADQVARRATAPVLVVRTSE